MLRLSAILWQYTEDTKSAHLLVVPRREIWRFMESGVVQRKGLGGIGRRPNSASLIGMAPFPFAIARCSDR